ncbi:hypothetical protein RRG08_033249 [Elysia crispata]|uniref:Uncharacterized protein n=1 Tax=Elysia crispata TaxID=231223 RepID=A0AAE1DMP9_9GAST|nr:hypothetical protein RRG08_033249 [Elysia crispata]
MYCASKIPGFTNCLYNASTGVCSMPSAAMMTLVAHIICDAWLDALAIMVPSSACLPRDRFEPTNRTTRPPRHRTIP